ncbi:DUF1049 domain-containing protein [Mangrovimicrobium sediminis]|uniref:DUF1049 domain-containing protein n=1 Tax=Mangrovimicrobium sediminis TaxID=2562682 RepID=A0A4Z0M217_9GAMM|nr:lipopolysaccharide assembly protein LapA domain-containing protein [Haliea sp. SAOS-164]TGD73477.1 DUF1049 domain-containing protein [Haliea sp. SAOS-164]
MKLLRKLLIVAIALLMVAIGVLFAVQNEIAVPLDLLLFSFEPHSLALWLLLAFALGGVLGLLMSSAILLQMRARLGAARRQLVRAQSEAEALRSAPPAAGE